MLVFFTSSLQHIVILSTIVIVCAGVKSTNVVCSSNGTYNLCIARKTDMIVRKWIQSRHVHGNGIPSGNLNNPMEMMTPWWSLSVFHLFIMNYELSIYITSYATSIDGYFELVACQCLCSTDLYYIVLLFIVFLANYIKKYLKRTSSSTAFKHNIRKYRLSF